MPIRPAMASHAPGFDRRLAFFAALSGLTCTLVAGGLSAWQAYGTLRAQSAAQARAHATHLAATLGDELKAISTRAQFYSANGLRDAFESDGEMLALSVYERPSQDAGPDSEWKPVSRWLLSEADPSRLGPSDLAQADLRHPIDFERIRAGKREALLGTSTGVAAFVRLAIPYGRKGAIAADAARRYDQALVAEIKLSKLQALFAYRSDFFVYLAGARDELVIASASGHFGRGEDISALAPIDAANRAPASLASGAAQGALEYSETPQDGAQFAAFAQVPGGIGLTVVAQTPRADALVALTPIFQALAAAGFTFALLFGLSTGWLASRDRRLPAGAGAAIAAPSRQMPEQPLDMPTQPAGPEADDPSSRPVPVLAKIANPALRQSLVNGQIKLAGEKIEAPALHAHLHGMDRLASHVAPEILLGAINRFNQAVVHAVESRHGIVDHMHGGSVVAFWGVPEPREDAVPLAIAAALEIRTAYQDFAQSLPSEASDSLRLGMGLHYGALAAGQVGSAGRLEYSAVGEAIEVAGRIHQFADQFGTDFLLTGPAVARAGAAIATERLAAGDDDTPELFELAA